MKIGKISNYNHVEGIKLTRWSTWGTQIALLLPGCINFRANEPNAQMKEYPSQDEALSSGLPNWGGGQDSVCLYALTHMLGIYNTDSLCNLYTQLTNVLVLLWVLRPPWNNSRSFIYSYSSSTHLHTDPLLPTNPHTSLVFYSLKEENVEFSINILRIFLSRVPRVWPSNYKIF